MIELVLCTDNNYALPAGVMMYSVCRNSGAVSFHIIVPEGFNDDNKRRFKAIADASGSKLSFITIDEAVLEGYPVGQKDQPEHISIAAYYRLFLTDLLPEELDKVLYLDCDIICMRSLQEFWDIDIEGRPLACISDIPYTGISEAVRLGYDDALGYFNSGVLLINLKYWRDNNVKREFIDFLTEHRELVRYHDQDVLNCVFKGKALFISPKFNAQDRLFHYDTPCFPYPDSEVEEARKHPIIVHFTYKNKPWILGGRHPYQRYFTEYKARSPWKYARLKPKKATNLKEHLVNVLVCLGLYKYHDDYIPV